MPKLTPPEEYRLSNGIPVIFQDYDGQVAATYWWVQAGSADERPKEAGFAHFLEHMLFKDAAAKETGQASTGQMALAIESLGGDINAYTSFDQTVYHVTCAAHHWEKILDAFATIAKPQKFLKLDFEREREVILEELRKNEDSPSRMHFQALFSATYRKHPYGRPVIGFPRTLKAAKVQDLEAFYRRQYISGKMGIVMVGPTTPERRQKLLKILEKRVGNGVLKRKGATPEKRPIEPPLRSGITFDVLPFDVKTPSLMFSFRAPALTHEDIPALDLAASILGMGELSRLYQRLFYDTRLATDASAGLYVPRDAGMFYLRADLERVDQIEPAAVAMMREVMRLAEEPPTAEEVARVLVNAESERLYAGQSADGLAGRLGFLQFVMHDLSYDQHYLEQLRALDPKTISATFRNYVDPKRLSMSVLVPKEHKDWDAKPLAKQIEGELQRFRSEGERAKKTKKSNSTESAYRPEIITLKSGAKVIYRERPQSHVMSLYAVALGGLRLELGDPVRSPDQDWGASNLLAMTWTKGTQLKDARAISALVEGSASSLEGFSGRHTIGLHGVGLARDWPKLSELFTEVLLEPTFPETEIEQSRRVVEESIRGIADHSSQLCSKLFLETLFERHPYSRLTHGSLESIQSMDSQVLSAFHRRWVRPERLVFSVVGNVWRRSLDLWLQSLDERLLQIQGKLGGASANPVIRDSADLLAPRWVEQKLGREQVHLIVGGLGLRFTDPERHALRLLNTILGGQSGRMFIELREKKSLAYSVSPTSLEGMERGYVGTYIACSPSKRDEAIAGIRSVLEKLAEKGPTASEMTRAREYYLGRRDMDLQGDGSLASYYGLEAVYGLPLLDSSEVRSLMDQVSAREVQAICQRLLVDPPMVTAAVG